MSQTSEEKIRLAPSKFEREKRQPTPRLKELLGKSVCKSPLMSDKSLNISLSLPKCLSPRAQRDTLPAMPHRQ